MNRRQFLAALAPTPRPNVVLILTDDMGYADLSCYGSPDIRTPHIDSLARDGVRLTDCYSAGPVCTPTRCALMTGRYQQHFGLEWAFGPGFRGYGLSPKFPTLARQLKSAGYRTAIHGKWHLGYEDEYNPINHGFDEFHGLLSGNVDHYSHKEVNGADDWYDGLKPVQVTGYSTELLAEHAVRFLSAQSAAQPFFLYLPFNSVHWPFQAPGQPTDVRERATWFDGTRAQYKAMLESIDAAVGRVLATLDQKGLRQNTLVLFTNDNGGERLSDNRPFFNHKATLWEGGIRVPGLLRWPGRIPAGRVSRQAAISMDFSATIAAACGVTLPQTDGVDLLPLLAKPIPRTLFWRIRRPKERQQRVCRQGNWKYMRDGEIESLIDLAKDPAERHDLLPQYPEKVKELKALYAEWEAKVAASKPAKVVN